MILLLSNFELYLYAFVAYLLAHMLKKRKEIICKPISMLQWKHFGFLIMVFSCFKLLSFGGAKLVQEEVDALQEIATVLGSKYWKFNPDSCAIEMVGLTPEPPMNAEYNIDCECNNGSSTECHVKKIALKGFSLPGMLPPQLVKLPFLQEVDFSYNYLNGTIPREWASTKWTSISLLVNRLSGEIPKELGNLTTLTYLTLEANQFSGVVPADLGKLVNLQSLMLSSNQLTGNLPSSLSALINLTDFRINDNNFSGMIPTYIQNWKQLKRLEMHASGLKGPVPSNISLLNNLVELRISDIEGPSQGFPMLNNATSIVRLVLRNCKISGELHSYVWTMKNLEMLDVSFNKLVGKIPPTITAERFKYIFLTGNLLSGDVPFSILRKGSSVDLSYNNFALQGPEQPGCEGHLNLNLNLFRSSSAVNNLKRVLPCMQTVSCQRYSSCFHVNCGGKSIIVKENKAVLSYEGDGDVEGGTSKYFLNNERYWGFSSTGDFMDDNDQQNTRYTVSLPASNISELYSTARTSPISLTYFHYCLKNGNYTVKLHFAEIQFTNEKVYNRLGRRMFDIYVQERLVWKGFNIKEEAGGSEKPLVKELPNVNVMNNTLEIRFYFAGKGTTRIPDSGVYGPIISAISVFSDLKLCSSDKKKGVASIIGAVIGAACLIFIVVGFLWYKGCLFRKSRRRKDTEGLDLPYGTFPLKQISTATNDFDASNKIGEGGFGPVYKGVLTDGTVIAVKQLSSKSRQGNREFLNEMGTISCLQHPNLVKLHGCCIEGDQLLLVYEYMENNSLSSALFGRDNHQLKLDWPTRLKICLGIAKGLAFLHEESRIKIVHRDIKATNVLLDRDLNPKISDFGLARLNEEEKSHISTRVAGTIGYMAPEYALWGYLTDKADVYSFGVVALEIVSGKSNTLYVPTNDCICLLDWACYLQQSGKLTELIDETLRSDVNIQEAEIMVKVGLLCTNASPTLRPSMSEVVKMLERQMDVPEKIPEPSSYNEDLRFKAMRDLRQLEQTHRKDGNVSCNLPTDSGSTSDYDSKGINEQSKPNTM